MYLNGTRSFGVSKVNERKLRYRALLEELSILEDEADNDVRMEKTTDVVREAQSLLAQGDLDERVQHPGEGFLDSQVLRATSDLALRCAEAISGNVNLYDKHELAQHIKENGTFWEFPFPGEVPPVAQLFGAGAGAGPAGGEVRERAPRRRLERQNLNAELKAPENVDRMEKAEEGSEMVSRVNRFINKAFRGRGRPLSYFHLVLDPDSFARTIENVYHLSFLVRDGLISIQLDEEVGLPMVRPAGCGARGAEPGEPSDENQFIVSLNMKRWKELTESFGITKPMMVLKRT